MIRQEGPVNLQIAKEDARSTNWQISGDEKRLAN
jgi:hypothetical protein